ncbi:hypothetical protein BH160DRAFT_7052 [Burkholderia sp. H160]|nr:hypothetical protein BH160DRAFT_7052 [Burkholderia sp. H160]
MGAAEGTTAFGMTLGVMQVAAANRIAVGAPIVANLSGTGLKLPNKLRG